MFIISLVGWEGEVRWFKLHIPKAENAKFPLRAEWGPQNSRISPPVSLEWKPPGTLGNLQLPFCISQGREKVQLDPGLCTQAVLQVLGLVLHG